MITSLACSCTDSRTAQHCEMKAKLSQGVSAFMAKRFLINLHDKEEDTFYLSKECKVLAFLFQPTE